MVTFARSRRRVSAGRVPLAPLRFIVALGVVSALMDIVYEGARGVTGPFLATLGGSAVLISVVTGAGEAVALVMRLVSGRLADHPQLRWRLTLSGYGLTAVSVPLLGVSNALWLACVLVLMERLGKAVRSPAKDSMLAEAGSAYGRGKAFALHEALDQSGAFIGPLLVAAVLAASGSYSSAFAALALPATVAMVVLVWLSQRVPDTSSYEPAARAASAGPVTHPRPRSTLLEWLGVGADLPRQFWIYAGFSALTMLGYATFGLLSFHLVTANLLAPATVPVVYAVAMGVDALAAIGSGWLYDRVGLRVLIVLPFLAALVPWLGFGTSAVAATAGVLVWGAAMGVQESTMRAAVADIAAAGQRGSAYGIFTAWYGLAWLAGSVLIGLLYEQSVLLLAVVITVVQALASLVFLAVRPHRSR